MTTELPPLPEPAIPQHLSDGTIWPWFTQGQMETYARAAVAAALASPAVTDDTAMLDWILHRMTARALRDIGVDTISNTDRECIRAAMKAATP